MKDLSFLGSETSNGSGSWSFGLDEVVLDLMILSIAFANMVALLSIVFIVGFLSVVLPGISLFIGSRCADSGGVD